MSTDGYVIVGASLAGAKATETLREQGFDGPITLIGEETERPYERPPLSKDYLLGKADREVIYVHPESWYAEHGVDLRLAVLRRALDVTFAAANASYPWNGRQGVRRRVYEAGENHSPGGRRRRKIFITSHIRGQQSGG
jgi:hypothetical protein